jgi:hypothetical protein
MHLMIHLVHLTLLVLMQMKILFCGMKYHNKELFPLRPVWHKL